MYPTKNTLASLLIFTSSSLAQSTIAPDGESAYAGNAGWITFHPSAADGVQVTETYLAGMAYAANFGWLDMGSGAPDNGYSYSNASATDYGVNLAPSGALTGYAYSANIGWIQFEQLWSKPKMDHNNGEFSGYAYSANIGWISLAGLKTASLTNPDVDADGLADAFERRYFGKLTIVDGSADADGDGATDAAEYLAGTNPLEPISNLRITSLLINFDNYKANLDFTSVTNRWYTVEHFAENQGVWASSYLGLFPPSMGPFTSVGYYFPPNTRTFFRVQAHLPLTKLK